MAILLMVLKFAGLFLLATFIVRLIIGGVVGSAIYLLIYRKVLNRDFDAEQQTIVSQLYGLPVSAVLISLGSTRVLGFLHFGRITSLAFFVLLILFAIRDYADDAISKVARSFPGFAVEVLVYIAFLVNVARS